MGINDLFQIITILFHSVSKITYFGLTISSTIGHFIVKYIVSVITVFYTVFETLFSVIKILYEDYCVFVLDVFNKGLFCIYVIKRFTEYLVTETFIWYETTKNVFINIYSFLLLCFDSAYIVTLKVINFISSIPEVLKNCIILIGSGIWLALKVIPLGFVYLCSMCILFIGRSFNELKSLVQSIAMGIVNFGNTLITFLYDIPIEAQAGLILGTLLLYACMKYHSHIIQGIHRILEETRYLLHCIWTALESFLLRIVTNQQNVNAELTERERMQRDTESDATDEENVTLNLRSRYVARISSPPRKASLVQDQENMLCVVCQDRDKCIIILPCRHLCLCSVCSDIIQRELGVCPICRENVGRTMKIYV